METAGKLLRVLVAMRAGKPRVELTEALRSQPAVAEVTETANVIEALLQLGQNPPDVVILEATLPGIEVVGLCNQLSTLPVAAQIRLAVLRPQEQSARDDALQAAGAARIVELGSATASLVGWVIDQHRPAPVTQHPVGVSPTGE